MLFFVSADLIANLKVETCKSEFRTLSNYKWVNSPLSKFIN